MKRLLRTVLTSLLLLAVPLQGYAAGVMLFCGAAHGRVDTATVDHAGHALAGHLHDGEAHHHDVAASNDDLRTPAADLTDLVHSACSVCASCCSGAALPAATIDASLALRLATPSLPTEHAAPDRAPARLERPPRIVLA